MIVGNWEADGFNEGFWMFYYNYYNKATSFIHENWNLILFTCTVAQYKFCL